MAGEPKSIGKALPAGGALQTILEAGDGEYIQINHIRVTGGDALAKVTAKISESSGSINIWNKKLVKANDSDDIYVQALEPGESLKVGADVAGVHLMVQYESSLSNVGTGSTPFWMKQQFALCMNGWVDSDYYAISDSTERYEFATDVSTSWISLHNIREQSTAFGNGVIALATAGYTNGDYRTASISPTDKHTFATLVTITSANLPVYLNDNPASVSNQIDGFVIGGEAHPSNQATNTTYKFNFAAETFTASGLLAIPRKDTIATGNTEFAIVTGGSNSTSGRLQSSEKFDYTTFTYSSATNLDQPRGNLNAAGNQDFGIFASGYPTSGGNALQTITKYTYSDNTFVVEGATLTHAHGAGMATSNAETGLFMGGEDEIIGDIATYVDKYDFATGAIASGSNMSKARGYGGAVSSAPGNF